MVMYNILFSKQSINDLENLKRANLSNKAKMLVDIMRVNPYQNPPPYEKLIGNLVGYLSRRINIKHRIVYKVDERTREVYIYRMWTHYE